MSLKPRFVDFDETWSKLKQTVLDVVSLRAVSRESWNARFSDVYALCVAHPEPMADRLYHETKVFLEEHISCVLEEVKGNSDPDSGDPTDGLLDRYVSAWSRYSQGACYLNSLYSYLNLQHVKRQKVSDAEIMYGSSATVSSPDSESRQMEIGELSVCLWERGVMKPLSVGLSKRITEGLAMARRNNLKSHNPILKQAILSTRDVSPTLRVYNKLVLEPHLEEAALYHAQKANRALSLGVETFLKESLNALETEIELSQSYLLHLSIPLVRKSFEDVALRPHCSHLFSLAEKLLDEADKAEMAEQATEMLHLTHRALRDIDLQPLVEIAYKHVLRIGKTSLEGSTTSPTDDAPNTFVQAVLTLHQRYEKLFLNAFSGSRAFLAALDRACSECVNHLGKKAPDLLAKFCDVLLRRRQQPQSDVEEKLSSAILVFKYVDDKDVFQKYYARALARRLIHGLSSSMEQEEAMIDRLKAVCGYEFTCKLNRMFTDVAVSADLSAKFAQEEHNPVALQVLVLQAGAWPLGGAVGVALSPLCLANRCQAFEHFYRRAFSGRRLQWLIQLSSGDMRMRGNKLYHLTATAPQCAILLSFDTVTSCCASSVKASLQLADDAWMRHLKPLIDCQLIEAEGDVENGEGILRLNENFSSKRTRLRLSAAPPQPTVVVGGGNGANAESEAEAVQCEDDRKMYLQAAIVRIMKQRKVVRHTELVAEVVSQAKGSFAPSMSLIKKCVEALIDKQYLERMPQALDTYSYLA